MGRVSGANGGKRRDDFAWLIEDLGPDLMPGPFRGARIKARIFRAPDGGPIRTLTERPSGRPMGRFQSAKAGASLPWVEPVQYAKYWICEADPDVARFMAQPHRLEFPLPRGSRDFFPDLRIETRLGATRIERLIPARGVSARERETIDWARDIYRGRGWEFDVVHHADVVHTVLARNAETVASDKFTVVTYGDLVRARDALARLGSAATYGAMIAALGGHYPDGEGAGRARLHQLIMDGQIWVDLKGPLRRSSPVRPGPAAEVSR